MEHDACATRAKFIEKSVSVRDMFSFARPAQTLTAMATYCCDFYGSNLWDLYGVRAEQCYRAWTTAVKLTWNMPRTTHTWMVDNLLSCNLASAREKIMANYVGFLNRLGRSASWEVRILSEVQARDAGSVTGRNIINLREEFERDPRELTSRGFRELYHGTGVPIGEEWVLDLLKEMIEERQERLEAGEEGDDFELLQSFIETIAEV